MTDQQPYEIHPMKPIVRVSEIRDETGALTHKMCCLCLDFVPVADLWVCKHGHKWDSCKPCAPFLGNCLCKKEE